MLQYNDAAELWCCSYMVLECLHGVSVLSFDSVTDRQTDRATTRGPIGPKQDQKDLSNLPSYRVINCYTVMFSL